MTGPQPPYGDQGAQTPGGGGDWQAPSNQTEYNAPDSGPVSYEQPQAYDQTGYEQPQQYQQPQAYDQYGQPPAFPDQYSAPPAGYPPQPGYDPNAAGMMPPTPSSTNYLPWVIGGVAGVLVLVLVVISGALLLRGGSGGGPGNPPGGDPSGGGTALKYSAANVSNACDLVDFDVLKDWAPKEAEEPEHTENKSDSYASLLCSGRYEAGGDDYSSASLNMYASVYGEESSLGPKDSYESTKKSAKGQTGTGRSSGDISGIGEDAYYACHETSSDYSSSVIYELGVLDGNLTFTISIIAFVGEGSKVTKDDAAKAAEDQAKKVMDGLKAA